MVKGTKRVNFTPYILILPSMVLFSLFTFYPFIKTIVLSFALTDKSGQFAKWVGFAIWERVLTNAAFYNIVMTTLKFAGLVGFFTFFIALIFALICNNKLKGGKYYELLYAIPMAIASAPAAAIWLFLYKKQNGILNYILGTDLAWVQDVQIALISISIMTVWLGVSASFLFLLVGFRNVPEEYLESAKIDGAGMFRRIFFIILPVASPQIFFVVFLNIVHSFKSFAEIRLLTGGGPANSTTTIIYSVYQNAILYGRFETACVQALVLFLIIFAVTRIQFMLENRVVHY
jgi:sn-glycerol 3-phosphate transport system permease protein